MSEPQYDQQDADVFHLMQEKRALFAECEQLRAALKRENKEICEAVQDAARWQSRYQVVAQQRDRLRTALVALVGVDGRAELEQLEITMRLMAAPAEDKAASVDAIHALIATCA